MKATGCSPPEALREGPRCCIAELALCNVRDGGLASGSFLDRNVSRDTLYCTSVIIISIALSTEVPGVNFNRGHNHHLPHN
jgi:hypothetical protein